MIDHSRPVLLDNTVLTNFALINRSRLVFDLWGEACTTTAAVLAEYQKAVKQGLLPADVWQELRVLTLTLNEKTLADQLSPRLGSGERTCIAIAVHRQGLFASDDLDARREARARNVALTGTLGILIAQVKRNRLSLAEGNALLNALIGQNYRSPVTRLDELILSENK